MTVDRRQLLARVIAVAGLAVAGGFVVPAASRAAPREVTPAAVWRDRFDAQRTTMRRRNEALSTSGDSWDLYALAYGLDAFGAMFAATGEPAYADDALRLIENAMSTATESARLPGSRFRDDHLGWASAREDTRGQEVPLFESYGWRYAVRLLRVMSATGLSEDPAFAARHEAALRFSEQHVFDKWHRRGVEQHLYRDRTHMASHWAFIANDLALLTDDRRRRTHYQDVAEAITERGMSNHDGASLRGQLERSGDVYVWSSEWGGSRVQDLAHGNNVVAYVVEAHETGRTFTDRDMELFVGTLNLVLDTADGRVGNVDGSGRGNGWISDGFVKLGRHDAALQVRLEARATGRGPQYLAAMADNATVLAGSPT